MAADQLIENRLLAFVLEEFLEGTGDGLSFESPLITSGILDSVGTLTLVTFLEDEFHVALAAHEADVENFNTISDMARLVRAKQAARASAP